MRQTITISLPKLIKERLDRLTKKEHLNRSDVVREALRQYFLRQEFRRLRRKMIPEAEHRGFYSDEDIYREVS